MKNLSIKKKLYFMILIILIPMIIYQAISIFYGLQESINLEQKANEDFAKAVNVSFNNYLERLWDTELSMGLAICNNTTASSDEIGQYMRSVLENQPTIREYGWVDAVSLKITVSSSLQPVEVSLAGRDYIDKILSGDNEVVSDMVISRIDNKPTFVVARGIRTNDVLRGIVIATINVEELGEIMPSNRSNGNSYFGLLDKQGVFVYRNGINDIASRMVSAKESPDIIPALKGETVKVKKYLSPITGKAMMGVNLPVERIGWVAYANTLYDEVLSRTLADIRNDLIILILVSITCLLFSIIIGKQIIHPLNILHESVLEMSKGNLNVRTGITGADEISSAAQAFDEMAASVEQYDKLKTQFFSNLSHELKTPLNIILASIQMIQSKQHGANNYEDYTYTNKYISMMKQNCYRLLRLINNLIDITRIDSGFLKLNFANYNIVSVIEDITLSVANYTESKGIELTFDTDVEEKIIGCDPDKIERIMLNLLSNSIKFTPSDGSIFVNIFDKADKLCITVRDTGIGIPSDKLSVIFERFRQVDSSLQREYEGSGIGLSLVKALVEAHKGNIYVQSELGQGSEFTIELPVLILPEDDPSIKKSFNNHNIDKVQRINIEFSDIYS